MVGVAGRSRACLTCKERRKGCDLRRPACKQCENSGYLCKGYNDETHFVVYGHDQNQCRFGDIKKAQCQRVGTQRNELIQLPSSLSDSAIANLIVGLAWPSLAGFYDQAVHFPWVQSMTSIQTNGTAPNTALVSVALARRGQELQDHSLVMESEVMYTRALSLVSRLFHDRANTVSDDALAAVQLLALYETVQGTSSRVSAWITHMKGLYELFQSRGAMVHDTFNAQALFRDFRLHGLIYAIGCRKSTFLAHSVWMGDPWQNLLKTDKDRLLDVMCWIPSLLETADRVKRCKNIPSALSDLYALRQSYAELVQSLENWRNEFMSSRSTPTHRYEAAKEFRLPGEEHLHALCPIAVHYSDVVTAETQILYWTTELILHSNFFMMYHFAQQTSVADYEIPRGFPTLGFTQETFMFPDLFDPLEKECVIRIYVNNIAESLEYFLRAEVGLLALNVIIFPMSLIMAFYEFFGDPKLEFVYAVMDKFQEKFGVPIKPFIMDMPRYEILRLIR